MVRKLSDLGVRIYFEKENIDTGSMESELMLSILSSLAENESFSISENNKWGARKRFKDGTFIISSPPYGYKNIDGKMMIEDEKAEVVKNIYLMYLSGMGTYIIAKELNILKIPSPKGGKWTGATVRAVLKNEKYTGDVMFQKTYTDSNFKRHINHGEENRYYMKNHHEAIISLDDYEKAKQIMEQRTKEKGNGKDTNRYQNRYALSGKIKCHECGSTIKRKKHYMPSGVKIAWACSLHIKDKNACSLKYIDEYDIKSAFVIMMNKLTFAHELILKPLYKELKNYDETDELLKLHGVEEGLEENAEKLSRLEHFMSLGVLEPLIFSEEKYKLNVERKRLSDLKESLINIINSDKDVDMELKKLMDYTSKNNMIQEFSDDLFKKVVKMKVVTGYLKVFQDTATLVFNSTGTMFYNTKLGLELDFYYANDLNIDLVLLYDNQLGFVLASPDAPFARQKFQDIGLNYFINEKNHTQITRFSTPMEFITEKFLFYMGLTDSYIADNETFGVGEEQLNVGDILAFKCADERKGVLKVIDINTVNQSLTFFMKVQRN